MSCRVSGLRRSLRLRRAQSQIGVAASSMARKWFSSSMKMISRTRAFLGGRIDGDVQDVPSAVATSHRVAGSPTIAPLRKTRHDGVSVGQGRADGRSPVCDKRNDEQKGVFARCFLRRVSMRALAPWSTFKVEPIWPSCFVPFVDVYPHIARTILPVAGSVSMVTRSCRKSMVAGSPGFNCLTIVAPVICFASSSEILSLPARASAAFGLHDPAVWAAVDSGSFWQPVAPSRRRLAASAAK
ncbi:hypothetical protein BLJAPNOD_04154 [Ensifer sp. M14]|nr:hypothetical protein BLJAPNOD_04154 [Ensifer sp. M14]